MAKNNFVDGIILGHSLNKGPVMIQKRTMGGRVVNALFAATKTTLVVLLAFVFGVSQFAVSLQALQSKTIGAIAVFENNLPPEDTCQGTKLISATLTGSEFDYGNFHVVMKSTGQINAENGTTTIKTLCSFTMENGSAVVANGDNGGTLVIEVGRDFIMLDGSIIEASGGTDTESKGGVITASVQGDTSLEGHIVVAGKRQGGKVTLMAQDIMVGIDGNVEAISNGTSGTNQGGVVKLYAQDITIEGNVSTQAQDQAGIIEVIANHGFTIAASGSLRAESGVGTATNRGGNVSLISHESASFMAGTVTAVGEERGGHIALTSGGSLEVSGSLLAHALENDSSNRGGSIRVATSQDLLASGMFNAHGQDIEGFLQLNYCALTGSGSMTPAAITLPSCTGGILINEILPNPLGDDTALKPAGEWVELYNYATSTIDVAGWVVYDSNNDNELFITNSNTNTGDTIISPSGFLVVYRNGDTDFALNNGNDTVRLYNSEIASSGELVDSFVYDFTKAEGSSFARIPDGGVWYDPEPTPGEPNQVQFIDYFASLDGESELEEVAEITVEEATSTTDTMQPLSVDEASSTQSLVPEITPDEPAPIVPNEDPLPEPEAAVKEQDILPETNAQLTESPQLS